MSVSPDFNMAAKPRETNIYLDFLTNCLQVVLTLVCKEETTTHNWAWRYTSFCTQNLERNLSIIIPGSQEYLPAVANSESVDTVQNRSPQLRCVQTTRAYLWPKLHLVGGDHPTLQFHPKTTRSREISQNMREKLPFSFTIWMMVESTLEWYDHRHYTASRRICARKI